MEKIEKAIERLARLFFLACMLATVALFLLVFSDMAMRSFVNVSIEGGVEISEYVLVAIGFLGLGYSQLIGGHIRVDFFFCKLPLTLRRVTNICILIALFCFAFVMARQIGKETYIAWTEQEYLSGITLLIPTWPQKLVAFLGSSMLGLCFITQIVGNVIGLLKNREFLKGSWL
jgi:C4-dicarboxylate transporter DctQ subunit